MYDFDEFENIEKKEQKIFEESYGKQIKASKKILAITFYSLALLYAVIAVIMYSTISEAEPPIIMSILCAIFFVVASLILIINPKTPNYKKFKERTDKYGTISAFNLLTRIEMLEKRVEELEKKDRK